MGKYRTPYGKAKSGSETYEKNEGCDFASAVFTGPEVVQTSCLSTINRRNPDQTLSLSLWGGSSWRLKWIFAFILFFSFASVHGRKAPLERNLSSFGHLSSSLQQLIRESGKNCTNPSSQDFPPDLFSLEARRNGAIVVHFIVSIYLFYAILVVCSEYLVPSVEYICQEFHISSDVAGATFMAVSTSAPELFTNVIGTFFTEGDLGLGTIVGSAIFNILAIGAICGIVGTASVSLTKKDVVLEGWPLTRDSIFYLVSVALLIAILNDQRVDWKEALAMLLLYCLYITALAFNEKLKNKAEGLCRGVQGLCRRHGASMTPKTPLLNDNSVKSKNGIVISVDKCNNNYTEEPRQSLKEEEVVLENGSIEEEPSCCSFSNLKCILTYPIRTAFFLTVPDCKKPHLRKFYVLTLLICVGWIGLLCYLISWMITTIGETLQIPDSVTGLTFLAAGTSIPEVISSFIVVRQGLGSMGFSNTIGSNTFDLLICLGLPWLVKCIISGTDIYIHSGGLEYSAMALVSALFLLYTLIAINGFVLDCKIGAMCILMYIAFISFSCMVEMNVFFPVNLPPCY